MNLEYERIKTLINYDILDSSNEEMFDDITAIASEVCNMPIALISLLDLKRQYFKSNKGLDIKETPIEYSFCKLAIKEPNEIFVVEDARTDSRFINNPFVKDFPNIVSYYGVPLNSKAGIAFGTLCVIDKEVKILSEKQKNILKKLSKQVEYLLELKMNNKLLIDYQLKVERYSKDMEEFAYLAAHDLKAPVRAIDSFMKILDKKHESHWDSKDKQFISFIHESSFNMNKLIQDLLEYSKSNVNSENHESFDLHELVNDVFTNLTYGIKSHKPILKCENLPQLFSAKVAFTILFHNLISNALKYQEQDQTAVIMISFIEDYTHWIFTIKDNGIGIEKEYFDQIFKPFKRLHNDSEFQGNGLGLAACSKIIDNLKGEISVDSVVGEGTTFTLKIPKI